MRDLSLNHTGIGSFPFSDNNSVDCAINIILDNYKDIPHWPQLPHFRHEENMMLQFSQNMVGFKYENKKAYFDTEDSSILEKYKELLDDYKEVISSDKLEDVEKTLNKYKITPPYSNAFAPFLDKVKERKPKYIKGSVTGAFSFSTSFNDKNGKCAFFNDFLKDIILKTIILKALWQMLEFKKAMHGVVPIIFIDEPSISNADSHTSLTDKDKEIIKMVSEISNAIKKYGGISGIHCCAKTDWNIVLNTDVDIINFDAYSFIQNVDLYIDKIGDFMKNGGYLSFGIVPTVNDETLNKLDLEKIYSIFKDRVNYLVNKGIEEDLILKQSFITPSCGFGSLSREYAIKAMLLTKELSKKLRGEI